MNANLSLYDYRFALKLREEDPPFYGLLGALMLKADTTNLERIRQMWPEEVEAFGRRYNAPDGVLPEDP